MLNLRQFNKSEVSQASSDARHFSRFSLSFRVPSNSLGNIGELLDHSQAERLHEDGDHAGDANSGGPELDTTNLKHAQPASGLFETVWAKESVGSVDRQSLPPAADSSRTPGGKESGTSCGGPESTAEIPEVQVSEMLGEQVRSASQLVSLGRAKLRLPDRCWRRLLRWSNN